MKITFIHGNERFETEPEMGESLMMTAARHRVPGIDADCGGGCSCATCHVYMPESLEIMPASDMEKDMLDFAEGLQDRSRLSCQITVTPDFDGAEIEVPKF